MIEYLSHEEVEDSRPIFRDRMLPWLMENYERMSPEDRYQETLDVYAELECTYKFPRKLLIGLKRIKPKDYLKDLPDYLEDTDPITVYRGTNAAEFLSTARTAPSWTIDKNVAIWFSQRFGVLSGVWGGRSGKVFSATIEKDKIIAYMDSSESEVVQHCGVKNIKEIPITQEEIDAAVEIHAERLRESGFNC